jgi:hypothetical protein
MPKTEYYWKKFFGVATEGNRNRQCLMKYTSGVGETVVAEIWQSYRDMLWRGGVDLEFISPRDTAAEAQKDIEELVRKTGRTRVGMKVRWSDN